MRASLRDVSLTDPLATRSLIEHASIWRVARRARSRTSGGASGHGVPLARVRDERAPEAERRRATVGHAERSGDCVPCQDPPKSL